jgi:hypothetical protein
MNKCHDESYFLNGATPEGVPFRTTGRHARRNRCAKLNTKCLGVCLSNAKCTSLPKFIIFHSTINHHHHHSSQHHAPGIRRPGKFICRYHQDRHHVQGTFRPSLLFCHLRIGQVVIKELSTFIGLFLALDRWVSPVVARVVGPQE